MRPVSCCFYSGILQEGVEEEEEGVCACVFVYQERVVVELGLINKARARSGCQSD